MKHLLDNFAWHSLCGPQALFATGTGHVRRYAPGFASIVAFADPERPDFDALAPYSKPDEHFYCEGWSGAAPSGWHIEAQTTMFKMIWEVAMPATDEAPEAVRLGLEHVSQMLELVTLTHPGPFGPRNIELGEYFGCFEGPRLVAMAGERMHAGGFREISGVCTHPDFQGRGFARRLVAKLIRRQMQRDEIPLLHVVRENSNAHRLYAQMGFSEYRESVIRIVSTA
jgi:GNAT superfamily N-acetyltransferase